jgi:hypothetical protein
MFMLTIDWRTFDVFTMRATRFHTLLSSRRCDYHILLLDECCGYRVCQMNGFILDHSCH